MTTLIGLMLLLLAAGLMAMIAFQAWRGTVELLNLRNFFLGGFIIFQLFSATTSLLTGRYGHVTVTDQPRVAIIYSVIGVLFLIFFLLFYRARGILAPITRRIGSNVTAPSPASMLMLAAALLAAGMFLRLVMMYMVGAVAEAPGTALITVAVGLAAWAAAPRLRNPAVVIPAIAITVLALLTVLLHTFGRRDIVGIMAIAAWAGYHSHWRYLGLMRLWPRLVLVAIPGLLLFVAFTGTRHVDNMNRTPAEVVRQLTSVKSLGGLRELTDGQMAAANSMWIIQTRPHNIPYDKLHSAVYFVSQPVPRSIWHGKPVALGWEMVSQARVRDVMKGFNLGPGIIGHIYNDNPWLALIPYALVLGLFIGLLDDVMRSRPWNPFVVLPIGVALGQILGLARGETGLFLFRGVVYILVCWIAMQILARILHGFGWSMTPVEPEESWEDLPEGVEEDYGAHALHD